MGLLSVLGASPILAASPAISRVIVRNATLDEIKTLISSAEIGEFIQHWSTRKRSPAAAHLFDYRIDLQYADRSERWRYDRSGFAQVLSKARVPVYQIASPNSFNSLLGI